MIFIRAANKWQNQLDFLLINFPLPLLHRWTSQQAMKGEKQMKSTPPPGGTNLTLSGDRHLAIKEKMSKFLKMNWISSLLNVYDATDTNIILCLFIWFLHTNIQIWKIYLALDSSIASTKKFNYYPQAEQTWAGTLLLIARQADKPLLLTLFLFIKIHIFIKRHTLKW